MKFAVGYQLGAEDEESFVDIVRDYREAIAEVYFPWLDVPTCRAALSERQGYVDWAAQEDLEKDLLEMKKLGVKLDLLFNANCYGGGALSRSLANKIKSVLEYLEEKIGGVEIITTTSPAIARIVKAEFPQIEIRASVNMKIGTVQGMEYVSDCFDSFHMQRDFNRDLKRIKQLKRWTDSHDKKLVLLANSGCLRFCSGQIFHDNCVAHEREIDETTNVPKLSPHICWDLLKKRENWVKVLRNTWIRPEDLHNYEPFFKVVKLATRMHSRPRMVLEAYTSRKFWGNLLDLCEPGFGPAIAPYLIDNKKFPADWFSKTSECGNECDLCGYCEKVMEEVLVKTEF